MQPSSDLRGLWSLPSPEICVVISTVYDVEEEPVGGLPRRRRSGPGDMEALHYIKLSLDALNLLDNISVFFSEDVTWEGLKDTNIILIGGPEVNRITGIALEALEAKGELSVGIRHRENRVWFDGQSLTPEEGPHGYKNDFGILVKARNPLRPDRLLFVLAGLHNPGTASSGALLRCPPAAHQIVSKFGYGSFQIVHETDLREDNLVKRPIRILAPDALAGEVAKEPLRECNTISQTLKDLEQTYGGLEIALEAFKSNPIPMHELKDTIRDELVRGAAGHQLELTYQAADYIIDRSTDELRKIDDLLREGADRIARYRGTQDIDQIYTELAKEWLQWVEREHRA